MTSFAAFKVATVTQFHEYYDAMTQLKQQYEYGLAEPAVQATFRFESSKPPRIAVQFGRPRRVPRILEHHIFVD